MKNSTMYKTVLSLNEKINRKALLSGMQARFERMHFDKTAADYGKALHELCKTPVGGKVHRFIGEI